MSIDIYGQICYGVMFERMKFPWDKEEFSHYISSWWFNSILKFSPSDNLSIDDLDSFISSNQPPVKIVSYAGAGFDLYILAIPSTVRECTTGRPADLDFNKLTYTPEERYNLLQFIETHITEDYSLPQWWLSCCFKPYIG